MGITWVSCGTIYTDGDMERKGISTPSFFCFPTSTQSDACFCFPFPLCIFVSRWLGVCSLCSCAFKVIKADVWSHFRMKASKTSLLYHWVCILSYVGICMSMYSTDLVLVVVMMMMMIFMGFFSCQKNPHISIKLVSLLQWDLVCTTRYISKGFTYIKG